MRRAVRVFELHLHQGGIRQQEVLRQALELDLDMWFSRDDIVIQICTLSKVTSKQGIPVLGLDKESLVQEIIERKLLRLIVIRLNWRNMVFEPG